MRILPSCVLIVLVLGACGPAPDPKRLPVLELPGKTLTVSDFEAYLDANLMPGEGGEGEQDATTPQDLNRVKSRLFDNFVDEEVLLFEAQRQGIEAATDEIDAYLRNEGEEPAGGPSAEQRREMARRDLAIQKLRETWVRSRAQVTPDEVDAYLTQHRQTMAPKRHMVVRSLLLASEDQAKKVRAEVARHRMSFDEAIASSGVGPGQGEPLEIDLGSLPEQVQDAVADLKPGEISEPVVVQGSTYLFFVQAWRSGTEDEEDLRRRAREELLRSKYDEASRQLLEKLRAKIRPKVEVGNLPFRYVSEEAS